MYALQFEKHWPRGKKKMGNHRVYLVIGRWYQEPTGRIEDAACMLGRCDKVEAKVPGAMIAAIGS